MISQFGEHSSRIEATHGHQKIARNALHCRSMPVGVQKRQCGIQQAVQVRLADAQVTNEIGQLAEQFAGDVIGLTVSGDRV